MVNDGVWIFIDDKNDEATAFADELMRTGKIQIEVLDPATAREQLLQQRRAPAGVLMDVDLSAIPGEFGTGPGIAQDIRTKQKAKSASEFPIVRFSAADPLIKNVIGDPSSEDLFELQILKNDVGGYRDFVVSQLIGLAEVYDVLAAPANLEPEPLLAALFGVDPEVLSKWGHEGMTAKILTGVAHSAHVAASAFCRLFLIPHGLLLDLPLLAVRLGVDVESSGKAWHELLIKLEVVKYRGAAHSHFSRWWSRGLEEWWFGTIDRSGPLAGKTAAERVALLKKATGIEGLAEIVARPAHPTFRPWRFCRLGLELSPADYIPIDPSESIRITTQADFPSWIEPHSASLKLAMQNKNDPRLNRKDLDRMRQKHGI